MSNSLDELSKDIEVLVRLEIEAEEKLEQIQSKLSDLRKLRVKEWLVQKSIEFGFELKADMRITCTPEMHDYATAHYLAKHPHRDDLADYHFPIGYPDMNLADYPDDMIKLQGHGSALRFPPDMVKRAVEGIKNAND